jgi:hypothetical protein
MFLNSMVEPDKKGLINKKFFSKTNFINLDCNNKSDLEDTVRNLREENAKLLQLLRSRTYHFISFFLFNSFLL